jgi:hypothetical protein
MFNKKTQITSMDGDTYYSLTIDEQGGYTLGVSGNDINLLTIKSLLEEGGVSAGDI